MKNIFAKILILFFFLAQGALVCHAQILNKKDIIAPVTRNIVQDLQKKGYKSVNVEVVSVPFMQLTLPDGKITYKISSNSKTVMARSFIIVSIYVNNEFIRTVGVPVKISALKDVYVAKETIGRGACLTANLLQLKTIDVTNAYVLPLEYGELNKAYVTTKIFPAGTIIDKKFLKSKPDIMKDSIVTMYFKSDNDLSITLEGTAISDGSMGEMIAVRNKKYNRVYNGKIIGENKVLIKI